MCKKLSVVIPCFNHGAFVAEAVESVNRSRRDDVELIVVDDGSTDKKTQQEMDRLSAQGVFVIRQKNGGLASARNAGIKASSGQYILPLDADNRIRPDYVRHAIRILDTHPEIGVVYGDASYFGAKTGRWYVGPFDKEKLVRWNYIDACAVFRRTVWEQNNGYDGTMPVQGFEDWDFWLGAVAKDWQFAYVPEILFDYRVAAGSMIERTAGRETAVIQFVLQKHGKMYAQAWFLLRDHTSFKATAIHALKLLRMKLTSRMARVARRQF